ncbi:helix-turn-helix domain-containing protein [Burkholderia vietnamiensis]|uniref:helix-turn-helix domain-containing protein n=1 Tax=Burkholderia vietnamiensis TaxID=60552 RepID=UPI001F5F4569|nr:helix-turn-helix domain-containing protein [Burkholderia vietnamiensis]
MTEATHYQKLALIPRGSTCMARPACHLPGDHEMRVSNPAIPPDRIEAAAAVIPDPAVTADAAYRTTMLIRPYLSTEEAADLLCRRPQTLRKSYALAGSFFGVRPKKVGRRLLWSREALMALIEGVQE